MLSVSNLSVSYGTKKALDDVTLSLDSTGQICGLFGPNGAGKTTLMNAIVGDIGCYSGAIQRPSRSEMAYLPDKPFLYPWMTIRQCFDLFENRHNDFRREVAAEIVDGFGLGEKGRVRDCSKGMSERLHLALIIARSASLYILDEPLAAVDPFTRDFLVDMIKTKRRPGSTALISTHLISDVESLFAGVVMIADGRLLYQGSAAELRQSSGADLETAFKQVVSAHV